MYFTFQLYSNAESYIERKCYELVYKELNVAGINSTLNHHRRPPPHPSPDYSSSHSSVPAETSTPQ